MARYGFIHDKLDIKFLILYFMARVAAPIDFPTLTELTVCDDGIGYFEFAEAVSELVESGHLTLEDGLYSITEKGRENGAACESSLPYSVKRNCSAQLVKLNGILRRNAQVRAETEPRPEGGYSAGCFWTMTGAICSPWSCSAAPRSRPTAWRRASRPSRSGFTMRFSPHCWNTRRRIEAE